MLPTIATGNVASATASTGYDVDNSLRLNGADNPKLSRTAPNTAPTNADKFTFSCWIKRSSVDEGSGFERQQIFDSNDETGGPNVQFQIYLTQNNLQFQTYNSSNQMQLITNRKFRDVSAWYSIIFVYDSSQGTASNRQKLYINGVQETSFSTETYSGQDVNGEFGIQNKIQMIGNNTANNRDFDGYMAEVIGVEGQALDPDQFGEFDDSGIWKPIDVSRINVGNLGFYLNFQNSGALGTDVSGVGNFTLANLTSTDQSTDTCTNNFATMNPLDNYYAGSTFSEGNCKIVTTGGNITYNTSTIGFSSGKWYMEVKLGSSSGEVIGVVTGGATANDNGNKLGNRSDGWGYDYRGLVENAGADEGGSFATFSSGNIIGVYADLDNNKLYFSKDGVLQNSGTGLNLDVSGSPTYFFAVGDNHGSNSATFEVNFGSPSFAISSGNTDGEYGNFEYSTTITGDGASKTFKALNTKNLAEYG